MTVKNWSAYQQEIFKEVESGTSVIIQACAGSGKSTTIREAVKRANKNTLVMSFNKSIQEENKEHFKNCFTFHGFGLKLIKDMRGVAHVEPNKLYKLTSEFYKNTKWSGEPDKGFLYALMRFITVYRTTHLDIDVDKIRNQIKTEDLLSSDTAKVNSWLLKKRTEFMLENINNIEKLLNVFDESSLIDMTDMIRIPAKYQLYKNLKYEMLVVDEVQDLDPFQIKCVIDFHLGRNNQVVLAGDSRQRIYSFRGVEAQAMELVGNVLGLKRMSLPITYRCKKGIVDFVNGFLFQNDMGESMESISDGGNVCHIDGNTDTFVDYINSLKGTDREVDMIISSMNSNLLKLYFDLKLKHGFNPNLKGIDVGGLLKTFIEKEKAITVSEIRGLKDELKLSLNKDGDNLNDKTVRNIKERIGLCKVFARTLVRYRISDLKELRKQVKTTNKCATDIDMFTVHASKGLEARNVVVIDAWFKSCDMLNMEYVAKTRPMDNLYIWEMPQ